MTGSERSFNAARIALPTVFVSQTIFRPLYMGRILFNWIDDKLNNK